MAQAAGACEPSAAQPAEESGEVSGAAPVLGEFAYATGEWAQWGQHQGYKGVSETADSETAYRRGTARPIPVGAATTGGETFELHA